MIYYGVISKFYVKEKYQKFKDPKFNAPFSPIYLKYKYPPIQLKYKYWFENLKKTAFVIIV